MKANRKDLLANLLCVQPGVSKAKNIVQSHCVVLRNGRFYTMSQEIACSAPSSLDRELDGAVGLEKFVDLIKGMSDDEIDIAQKDNVLHVTGQHKRRARLTMEDDVLLPIADVELPAKDAWQKLPEEFSEALALACRCCAKDDKDGFLKCCVHITKKHIESSDNRHALRYQVDTPLVSNDLLVRGKSIKEVAELGMTKMAETHNWLHFRNPIGLRMSVRRTDCEGYPSLSSALSLRGSRISLPEGLKAEVAVAAIFANANGDVRLRTVGTTVAIEGRNPEGEYVSELTIEYNGPNMTFLAPPEVLTGMLMQHTECELTERTLRVSGGKYIFIAGLEVEKQTP